MKPLSVIFKTRAGGVGSQPGLRFEVEELSWGAVGGPKAGRLAANLRTQQIHLDELSGLLRRPVEVYSGAGALVWWGYVHAASVQDGASGALLDLDHLANRVAVVYDLVQWQLPGGEQGGVVTGWADDLTSQAVYGIKEKKYSLAVGPQVQAEALQAVQLARWAKPSPAVNFPGGDGVSVTLELRGWWETLDWRFYSCTDGYTAWQLPNQDPTTVIMGNATNQQLAQSFTISSAVWRAEVVWLAVQKHTLAMETETFVVSLCADNAGVPGSVLATSTKVGADFPLSGQKWTAWVLSAPVTLAASTTYWLKMTTNGNLYDGEYFLVLNDSSAGYAGGSAKYYNGSAWVGVGDLQFKVCGAIETTKQIETMGAGIAGGQFLAGVRIDQASGVYTSPERMGNRTAKEEIETLLQSGTTGAMRLLGEIDGAGWLVVKGMPVSSGVKYSMRGDGAIRLLGGAIVEPGPGVAGQWAVLDTSWAVSAGAFGLSPGLVWLEGVKWSEALGLRAG